ncbi:acyl-CoA thioester hydrolase/BAAT C-terminal domain-containing protein [Sphingomonas yabuuchiae]|uniref:acyl-CoA thioester hydrolase/BAAT C-terminal domain-containing protein n=1 Tax=Sphingomonas yabuuchiae TaxID=172044 RepID=UPI003D954E17
MFRFLAALLLLGASAVSATAQGNLVDRHEVIVSIPVRDDGLVGTWFPPTSGKRGPVIIVLGGSEGGEKGAILVARALAEQGYGALSLAYFRAEGLPGTLQNVPLEYFDRALVWLARQPLTDTGRMGIYGVSIGAETALLVATRHPELKAVVVAVPSSVVWQGYDPGNYQSLESTYSLNRKGIPYLPYDTSLPFTGVYALYANSLKALAKHPDAAIPVEKIEGAVLLLSAKADTLWLSSEMSEQIMTRLDARKFSHPHRHMAFADAGHGATLPPGSGPAHETGYNNLGGTEAGNIAARAGMWRETLAFFGEYIGKGKPANGKNAR